MEDKKPIDGAEYISLEDAKRLKLPYFEGLAAGYPSPAGDYQHESLDLNEKFVHHPEASYFVRVRGESMIGLGILDGDICLADRQEEIYEKESGILKEIHPLLFFILWCIREPKYWCTL